MQRWQGDYQNRHKPKPLLPMPGIGTLAPGCDPLTGTDLQDAARAQTAVLKSEYPECFELFEAIKADPANETLREQLKLAYVRDIARKTGFVLPVNADGGAEHLEALVKAARSFKRRARKAHIDSAVEYEIAFGWLHKGYCFLGDKELAARINAVFGSTYTAKDIHNRRSGKLGLVQKTPLDPLPAPHSFSKTCSTF